MKRKMKISAVLGLAITLVIVGGVLAGSIGNIDGVWQYVEDDSNPSSNAYCVTYGTGPGTEETARSRNNPAIQTPPNTDENQIHYGKKADTTCPTDAPTSEFFDAQSGLGFDGNNLVGTISGNQVFLLGRLTHYNRPIWLSDTGTSVYDWAYMRWIDIDLNVTGVQCTSYDGNGTVDPTNGTSHTFTYRVNFDETPNTCDTLNPCKYDYFGDYCPTDGCPDAVTVSISQPSQTIQCGEDAAEEEQGTWTLVLSGFVPNDNTTCPEDPSGPYSTQYVTRERSTNNACLYGQIAGFTPSAVTLKNFSATITEDGVILNWETLSEVNTLGFNLYRSETLEAEKVRVNPELILSNLAPGSLEGALYEHLDGANAAEAYYWLEEIEIDGTATSYGWTLAR